MVVQKKDLLQVSFTITLVLGQAGGPQLPANVMWCCWSRGQAARQHPPCRPATARRAASLRRLSASTLLRRT